MSDLRKLGYKDRFTQYLVSTINDPDTRSINDELALSDGSQFLVIEVTREQYNKLFDAAMTGCDLVYPEESHNVLWPLWKAASVTTFCEAVAACIDSSPAVQVAVTNYLSDKDGGGFTGNNYVVLPASQSQVNMLPETYTCDNDHAFAMARAIVDAVHQAAEDVMQGIDALTDPIDLAAIIADEIPIISVIGAVAETVLWVKDTAFGFYQAAWSDTVRDEIACELFCMITSDPDCSITFEQVKGVYLDFAEAVNPPSDTDSLDVWLDWLYGLPLAINVGAVKAGGLLGVLAMWFGSKFGKFGVGHRSLETVMALAADETSNDWEILCDDCPCDWQHEEDFLVTNGGFVKTASGIPGAPIGRWVAGQGWLSDDYLWADAIRDISINLTFPETTITYIEVTGNSTEGLAEYTQFPLDIAVRRAGSVVKQQRYTGWGQRTDRLTVGGDIIDNVRLVGISDYRANPNDPMTGEIRWVKILFCGTGTNPFEGS